MTKQEYIDYWVNTAAEDWVTVEGLFDIKRYMHCLFWSHLVLEKLAKANWVKNHEDDVPPKVHKIVWLLEESGVDLGEETMMFLTKFNRFQLSTRYPDYLNKINSTCTESHTVQQLEKIKKVRKCLLEKL
jgi:HEPN domain-containing protein